MSRQWLNWLLNPASALAESQTGFGHHVPEPAERGFGNRVAAYQINEACNDLLMGSDQAGTSIPSHSSLRAKRSNPVEAGKYSPVFWIAPSPAALPQFILSACKAVEGAPRNDG
jgi:hypothetical protein